jgi:hypothetical protein
MPIPEQQCLHQRHPSRAQQRDMLQSAITLPIKNFFFSSSLAPTRSSPYSLTTGTSLNCTSPFSNLTTGTSLYCQPPTHFPILNSLSDMMLNCTFSIPVSRITHSSEPPRHSSHIVFIEDTDDTQHKVMYPTPQMYLRDRSRRGPDSPVACAPACFTNAQLDHDLTEHYPCSAPLFLDPYLDALNGHGSISEIDTDDMPSDNSGISDTSDISTFLAISVTSAPR